MATYDEHVPVLIVGGGYAGLASSLFLSNHGVRSLLVDRHPGVSIQGRARGINQRTMEVYRPLGIAPSIAEVGKPFDDEAGVARCSELTGEWQWLFEDDAPRGWPEFTAAEFVMADQNTVEPILIDAAKARGADQRFNTELVSFEADDEGVTAVIADRGTGERRTVRADYLIGADGHRSPIREAAGITRTGPGITQYWVSIVFEADLSEVIKQKAMFWIILSKELGFASFLTTAVPGRWSVSVTYDPSKGQSIDDFTPERCVQVARAAVGVPDLEVNLLDASAWEQAIGVADAYRSGRVLLAGDSAHVWPPAGAMGANSGVQDAHNLAWKLAAVVKGYAAPSLLDSYEAERRPVAKTLADLIVARQQARFNNDTEYKDNLDDQICTLGQRYQSSAVLGATHETVFADKLAPSAQPGERAPHLWLDSAGLDTAALDSVGAGAGERIGLHDLVHNSFVVLTGANGAPWVSAAAKAAERTGAPVRAYRVGAAGSDVDVVDVENQWESRYGLGSDGVVLLRPDGYVAWRSDSVNGESVERLSNALTRVLRG